MKINETELTKLKDLYDEMRLSIAKALAGKGDNTIMTCDRVTKYMKQLGEKYGYNYQLFGIHPRTGVVTPLK